jgi:hypothetical protein
VPNEVTTAGPYERGADRRAAIDVTGLNNLAALLHATNRLAEAEPLYRRALAILEKSFVPNHPKVARGLKRGLVASYLRLVI